jgi:putative spermidine/putrescine transport system permease protein
MSGEGRANTIQGRRTTLGTASMLAPILLLFLLAYLLPLAGLVFDSFHKDGSFTFDNHLDSMSSRAFRVILWRTLTLSAFVTLFCLLIAYPLAYTLARLPNRVAAGLLLLVSIPYITSILIRSYAWVVLLANNGIVNKLLLASGIVDEPIKLAFSEIGTYIGMIHVQLPLMVFPLYAAMHRIDRALLSAARNLGSTPAGAFFHVFLPLSLPGVASGCILVFLSCLGFYVTPALLGGPGQYMLAQGITVRVLTLADFSGAAAQATLLLLVVAILFVALRRRFASGLGMEAQRSVTTGGLAKQRGLRAWPTWLEALTCVLFRPGRMLGDVLSLAGGPIVWAIAILTLLYLIVPLLLVIPLAFSDSPYLTFPPPGYSLRWFKTFLSNARWLEGTGFSFATAGIGALLSLAIGIPAAFAIVRRPIAGRLPLYLLLISPLIVPHVIVALAMFFTMARVELVGTSLAFIIAYALIGVPYVFVLFIAGLLRFDRSLEMAAASLGASQATVLRTVTLPLLIPTLASALLFAFIIGFDDVVFGLFLSGPEATPLPIRMWDDIRLEISPQIAVVAVLLFASLAIAYSAYLVLSLLGAQRRARPSASGYLG